MSYVSEKLWSAVDMLDSADTPLRDRLANAVTGALLRLESSDFPDPGERAAFDEIMARFCTFAAIGEEGSVAASAQLLSAAEAKAAADAIRALQRRHPFPDQ
jgi:hypothetical protein